MSTKNSLKDRIKKPNATQAFFNSYDTNNEDTDNLDNNEDDNIVVDENKTNDNIINKDDVINKENVNNKDIAVNKNNDKTYVINDNDNINIVVDNDEDDDYLRELATGKKPIKKKNKKVFTSFYMDPDLAMEVDKIAARGEKGDKSKLINKGIRRLLEEYGVIEKK
ncbi:ribbon-helix-helix domain-containing protein [Bacillus sp. EB600]|uniref:ribbon-helix-helix domain-containing protein n=1 Tax=Bacillus sp. EB600 TaxID=2806345 RepID=UPI002109782C|nr:ribbon-helix-helix domain-containing protein [Bacillus sp. EB600]MCQ6281815.1 hypothetical protein [Bacillus sp. EB600]